MKCGVYYFLIFLVNVLYPIRIYIFSFLLSHGSIVILVLIVFMK